MAALGSWGDIVFEVSSRRALSFAGMEHGAEAAITEHQVLLGRPQLEFAGPGAETMRCTIHLLVDLGVDPRTEYGRLYAAMTTGVMAPLVVGGLPWGGQDARWLLASLSGALDQVVAGGAVRQITASATFRRAR